LHSKLLITLLIQVTCTVLHHMTLVSDIKLTD